MLKIGEFSRLSQVTVKTLHHYDDLGLLKPVRIDPLTGYRFYTVEQLPRIHRIIALKELGLSLEQIGLMLDEETPTEQIRGMLRLKQAEIQQEIREAQRQLAMVEFRLRMIEAEAKFPHLDVVIKRLEPVHCLTFFPRVQRRKLGIPIKTQAIAAVRQAIMDGRIQHTGTNMEVLHGETILPFESPELDDEKMQVLLSVSVSQLEVTLDPLGLLKIHDEPAIEQAATLMIAKDDSGLRAYEKVALLRRWTIAHGYKPHDRVRYLYFQNASETLNRDEMIFEAQLPVDAGD
jgi:DNA-binding transcriptional MerR regulator